MTAPFQDLEGDDAVETMAVGEAEAAAVKPVKSSGRGALVFRRFCRNKLSLFGLVVIALLFFMAYVGPYFTHWTYLDHDYEAFYQPPSGSHWFGTDQTGGDLYALVWRGAQKSLIIGLLVAVLSTSVAAIVGSAAGYFGGVTDRTLTWIIDLLLVVPSFLILAIMSPLYQGKTWLWFVVLLAIFNWMITARVLRGYTLTIKNREFVRAAKYMGVSAPKIIFRHILPNISSYLIIDATINVGAAISAEATLSFLGFGIQSPDISLGTLISTGQHGAIEHPWVFYFPAGLLVLIILAVNLVGDGLRDALDPTSQGAAS